MTGLFFVVKSNSKVYGRNFSKSSDNGKIPSAPLFQKGGA